MEEKIELEPCPLCGGESGLLQAASGRWRVWCLRPSTVCGLIAPDKETGAEAIAAWNRRSSPSLERAAENADEAVEAAKRIVAAFDAWRDNGHEYPLWEKFVAVLINGRAGTNAVFVARALVSLHASSSRKRVEVLEEALKFVRGIIVDAAMIGFNCHDGDWAERLFASQAVTIVALKAPSDG